MVLASIQIALQYHRMVRSKQNFFLRKASVHALHAPVFGRCVGKEDPKMKSILHYVDNENNDI